MTDLEQRIQSVINRARVPSRAAAEVLAMLTSEYALVLRGSLTGDLKLLGRVCAMCCTDDDRRTGAIDRAILRISLAVDPDLAHDAPGGTDG